MKLRIGIVGCGTVGQGFLECLDRKADDLRARYGFEAKITAIADPVRGNLIAPQGLDIRKTIKVLAQGGKMHAVDTRAAKYDGVPTVDIIETAGADLIAELTPTDLKTGEPATSHIVRALMTGKHVVTTNKGPLALHYRELSELARKRKLAFRFEGAVMSGTPVFNMAEAGLAGVSIKEIRGILNGTTNYILGRMEEEGLDFAEALSQARKLGYAETDPSADVEGRDALAKIVILANVLLDAGLKPAAINPAGIGSITRAMIASAREDGFRYKLIAYVRREGARITAGVGPRKLSLSDPLARIAGARNALTFDLDLLGSITLEGPGAGRIETGYAVLQDVLAIHRDLK
ncbi:MAG: homoserine dehydrogenase [Acidobacteriota bacterium]|nr:homoserine dehydrogenase [Acidobacteriota bacterium]